MIELKPCPFCGKKPIIETWSSGGNMYMVKCGNMDCPVPLDGYPSGHRLDEVKEAWNRRVENEPIDEIEDFQESKEVK